MTNWQPMDTAPKDCTEIMLCYEIHKENIFSETIFSKVGRAEDSIIVSQKG